VGDSIVVGTDGSDTARLALEEAVRLAKALGADLHVVSAFKPLRGAKISGAAEGAAKIWAPLPDSQVDATLSEAAALVRARDVKVTTHAIRRDPVDALLEVAAEVEAGMVVVGSKGMHGATRLTLGNVPNQISHKARCNVLIVATDRQRSGETRA
jgi:nucleotide-binding universal stress UspA family protein